MTKHEARHSDSVLCSIAQSEQDNFWLEFHTELHSAESQIKSFLKKLRARLHSAEFFGTAPSRNTNVSAFVTAFKATV
jgi:hypothetical protein